MGFRGRLNLFFVLMVVLPLLVVGSIAVVLVGGVARERADTRLGTAALAASGLLAEDEAAAGRSAAALVRRPAVAAALAGTDRDRLRRALEAELDPRGLRRVRWSPASGAAPVDVGGPRALLLERRAVRGAAGARLGTLEVSTTGPTDLASRIADLTGVGTAVHYDGVVVAATDERSARVPPERGGGRPVDAAGGLRSATVRREGARGRTEIVLVAALEPAGGISGRSVAALLAAVLIVGLAATIAVSRAFHARVEGFLVAARRIGDGRYDERVPVTGSDEFAELAREFNRMSAEVSDERVRVREAMRRLGEAFGSNLDRDGLLAIVLRAALDGTRADAGRAVVAGEPGPVASAGDVDGVAAALAEAERLAWAGDARGAEVGGGAAIAVPLRDDAHGPIDGVLSIARGDGPLGGGDRELLGYLAAQVAVSLRNVALHERARADASRDPLTGLANRRSLDDALDRGAATARRGGTAISLLLVDVDRFKGVNDLHGHPGGDEVLRTVGEALASATRDGDLAARWGGEEFALLLPGTPGEAAVRIAERLRGAIGGAVTTLPGGASVRVTASIGVASAVGVEAEAGPLVTAADEALYEAKHAGRNRTVTADGSGHEG